jgi:hypothetical protein
MASCYTVPVLPKTPLAPKTPRAACQNHKKQLETKVIHYRFTVVSRDFDQPPHDFYITVPACTEHRRSVCVVIMRQKGL